jgi:ABC-type Na+ efflux pump permease subunit
MPDRIFKRVEAKIGHGTALVLVIVLVAASILANIGVAYLYTQQSGLASCMKDYLSGSAPLVKARDDAVQSLWDDFATSQDIDPTDKVAVRKLRTTFFADLETERGAYSALNRYRDTHAPRHCP